VSKTENYKWPFAFAERFPNQMPVPTFSNKSNNSVLNGQKFLS